VVEREGMSGDDRRSPFPGMDPYLEDPAGWPGVHDGLIALVRTELNRLLGPGLVADIGTTVYVIAPDERRWVFPDIFIVETTRQESVGPGGRIVAPVRVVVEAPATISQPYVIIRDRASRAVVTMIEILSPINKAPTDTRARADFLRKRADVMASGTHWVEIDLLRAGERPPEVRGAGDYYALVKRVGAGDAGVWPFGVRDRLPLIGVPLSGDAPDVPIDLQMALDRLYQQERYADLLDYSGPPPPPPFPLSEQQWVAARLAGRRAERP
jgi:Protein of unknown function (DUF4058)